MSTTDRGGRPLTAVGHRDEARLTGNIDLQFDIDTLFDTSDEIGEWIVRHRAQSERDTRALAGMWHQQRAALQSVVDGLDRFLRHHDEAVRLDNERFGRAAA